jgi:endonuclease-3
MANEKEISKVFQILEKHYKNTRRTNLNREAKNEKSYTPFQTLISCLLSLRVKDETTEKISKELFEIAKTPDEILNIEQEKLEKIIFSSGYYKNKAKTLKRVSEQIINQHRGNVPDTKEKLLELYGVGPKTANIVLCFSFNKIVIPVDTNVHRVCNRLGWVKTGKNKFEDTEKELEKILPKKYWREINGIFILHGKDICLPISPKCSICPIRKICKRIDVKKSR